MGEAEYRTGHNVEAAQHLADFLARPDSGSAKQREAAQRSLEGALQRIATIRVDADLPGIEISVDGKVVATTPNTHPLYLSPGNHLLKAAKVGYRDYAVELELTPGDNRTLIPSLGQLQVPAVPPPSEPLRAVPSHSALAPQPVPRVHNAKTVVVVSTAAAAGIALGVAAVYGLKASSNNSR